MNCDTFLATPPSPTRGEDLILRLTDERPAEGDQSQHIARSIGQCGGEYCVHFDNYGSETDGNLPDLRPFVMEADHGKTQGGDFLMLVLATLEKANRHRGEK